jgi:ABC-2 type transport system permease protein
MIALWIAWHNMRRTIGSKKSLAALVIVPVIVISAAVALFGRSSDEPAIVVVTVADTGRYGDRLADELRDEPLFMLEERPGLSSEALQVLVSEGEADAAIMVPEGYSDGLLAGRAPEVELYRKTEEMWNASLVLKLEEETGRLQDMAAAALQASATSGMEPKAVFEQLMNAGEAAEIPIESTHVVRGATEGFILVIGLLLLFMMTMANQSIYGVLEDREHNRMARIYSAPVRALQIAFGHFLGSVMLGFLQLIGILAMVRFVLGYEFGVPFGSMLLVLTCFLFCAVGTASAVASFVRSSSEMSHINNLVVVPSCMLGGCFWPVNYMPAFMQKLSNFTPQRWAIKALEELSVGASLLDVSLHLSILLLLAALLLASGAYVLQPSRSSL